ncbi:hypothetical protein AB0F91_42900 [Amycolatopsis sp. NPDC023774]|uniref:non-homologous end-joining DNA ligase LigD n=1 Tax=Amycolatopsis sp. NPDC023774 TaxID=3155015 RepID=UPI0033C9E3B3
MAEQKVTVQVGQRRMALSNLDKPLYPNGFTKGEVVRYYTCIASFLLPHIRQRPITMVRFPEGTNGRLRCGGDQSACEMFASQTKIGRHETLDTEREIPPKTAKPSSETSESSETTAAETTGTSTPSG